MSSAGSSSSTLAAFIKANLLTYGLIGAAWWWNEKSPLGWWTLKPRTQARPPADEIAMAGLYERRVPPYPADAEAVEEWLASGQRLGARPQPRAMSDDHRAQAHRDKVEREAAKLWLRMRREAAQELAARGLDAD
eukprot:SM000237S08142  [mRNA]  locus=s237:85776:86317:- [translate_table: standard]